MIQSPRVWICPESELATVLDTEGIATVFSFGSPSRPAVRPDGVPASRFHAFAFNDIENERSGLVAPSGEDVARLIALVRAADTPTLVFQCWFGVSRSTAAALIARTARGRSDCTEIARQLRRVAPWATPNRLMISLADRQLRARGELVAAVSVIGRGAHTNCGQAVMLSAG